MNIFRLLGDFSHLAAIIILLFKIWKTRSCAGVSGKSILLYAIIFTCRYLDIFTHFISLYNSIMKIIYLVSTYFTLYLIYRRFKATYDRNHDTFRIEFLILPSVILALLWNHEFSVFEVLWTFSIYLESVAILPQLFMVSKTGETETLISHYLFALGIYRFLYILNWIYRYYTENFIDWISITSGVVQTVLYCGFFYLRYLFGTYKIAYHLNESDQAPVKIDFTSPFKRLNLIEDLEKATGEKFPSATELTTRTTARLIDKLASHFLGTQYLNPTFLCYHPQLMSSLAKFHRSILDLTERFKLFICYKETCNADTELNDPIIQREKFESQAKNKDAGDDKAQLIDENFCTALEYDLPSTGGMGIDRVTMMLTDSNNIKEVLLVPAVKSYNEREDNQKPEDITTTVTMAGSTTN